jgi:hypothetical protein
LEIFSDVTQNCAVRIVLAMLLLMKENTVEIVMPIKKRRKLKRNL